MERRWIFFHNGKPFGCLVALVVVCAAAAVMSLLRLSGTALVVANISCAAICVAGVWLCILMDRPRKEQ